MKLFRARASTSDGLQFLADKEIMAKVRLVPTKLKRDLKTLLKKLESHKVRLDKDGNVDFSQTEDKSAIATFSKKLQLVQQALLLKDLKFDYPQHLDKLRTKATILESIEEEERKLDEEQEDIIEQVNKETPERDLGSAFAHQYLLEDDYKFVDFEDEGERLVRLKREWLKLRRHNALESPQMRTTDEQFKLQQSIVEKIRDLRFRVDKELLKRKHDPVFKHAYHLFTKDEFMIDADVEFDRLKRFLNREP